VLAKGFDAFDAGGDAHRGPYAPPVVPGAAGGVERVERVLGGEVRGVSDGGTLGPPVTEEAEGRRHREAGGGVRDDAIHEEGAVFGEGTEGVCSGYVLGFREERL
jgi:hypothetical protein